MTLASKIVAVILAVAAIISVAVLAVDILGKTAGESVYILRSENNRVALYCDEVFVESFDGVSVDNLPVSDRRQLKNGIEFKNVDEARRAVEDYDG